MLTQPCARASEAVNLPGACEPSSLRACGRVRAHVGSAWGHHQPFPGPPCKPGGALSHLTSGRRPDAAYHTHGLTCAACLAGASLTLTLTIPLP